MARFCLLILCCFIAQDSLTAQSLPPDATKSVAELRRSFRAAVRTLDQKLEQLAKGKLKKTNEEFSTSIDYYNQNFDDLRKAYITQLNQLRAVLKKQDRIQEVLDVDNELAETAKLNAEPLVTGYAIVKRDAGSESGSASARQTIVNLESRIRDLEAKLNGVAGTAPAKFSFVEPASIAPFRPGSMIYSNRDYPWNELPERYSGWGFTKHDIRTSKTYSVNVDKGGFIAIVFDSLDDSQDSRTLFEDGWMMLDARNTVFKAAKTQFQVAVKLVEPGIVKIPLAHPNSGTIVLVPPNQ